MRHWTDEALSAASTRELIDGLLGGDQQCTATGGLDETTKSELRQIAQKGAKVTTD